MNVIVDGTPLDVPAGTTVAAALLNAGRHALRASVRGSARGPVCGMGVCFECRVSVDGQPHVRACLEPVRAGMHIDTQAAAADSGAASVQPGSGAVVRNTVHDIAVVGAGPAGIAAAVRAAEAGASVVLLDEGAHAGGQIWRHTGGRPPRAAARWLARLESARASGRIELLTRTTAADLIAGEPHTLVCAHAGSSSALPVRARAVVLAAGARERLLPFPGWTLPGIVAVGGAQALLKSGLDVRGLDVVVAGTGPLLLPVAAALARAGARVRFVAEQAEPRAVAAFARGLWRSPSRLLHAAAWRYAFRAAPYRTGTWVAAAHPADAPGEPRVGAVMLTDGQRTETVPCDLLCVGWGLVPSSELARVAGCSEAAGFVRVDAVQQTTVAGVYCAGEATAIGGAEAAVAEGEIAGLAACGRRVPARLLRQRDAGRLFAGRLAHAFALRADVLHALRAGLQEDTVICRCEDVPAGDLRACSDSREAKLMTRAGMGACQARICGAALQTLYGWSADAVRPPVLPVPVGALMNSPLEDGGG